MKALLFIFVLVLVAAIFFFAGQSSTPAHNAVREEPQEQTQSAAVRPPEVSALTLYADYRRNEVAADNVYKGRTLAVKGVVASINKDFLDKLFC
jgi:hypothetical protein